MRRINIYTVFQKSDAKIQITITTSYLIRIKYPLSSFNYHLSDVNVAETVRWILLKFGVTFFGTQCILILGILFLTLVPLLMMLAY